MYKELVGDVVIQTDHAEQCGTELKNLSWREARSLDHCPQEQLAHGEEKSSMEEHQGSMIFLCADRHRASAGHRILYFLNHCLHRAPFLLCWYLHFLTEVQELWPIILSLSVSIQEDLMLSGFLPEVTPCYTQLQILSGSECDSCLSGMAAKGLFKSMKVWVSYNVVLHEAVCGNFKVCEAGRSLRLPGSR